MDDDRRPTDGYTPRQHRLHWIVAALVILQLLLGWVIATTRPANHHTILLLHAAIGTTIFALMVSRLRLRQRVGAPPPPEGIPLEAAVLARSNHLGYYVLLLALPVIGWGAFLFDGGFGALHGALAAVLVLAICAHLAGVLYHTLIRRDGLLERMTTRS